MAMLGSISVEGLTGAAFGPNYGPLMEKVRQILDPNEVSDPPHNTHDKVVDMFAPEWREKYRF